MITRRSIFALLSGASAAALFAASAEGQSNICPPGQHYWVPAGQAPGTGRIILRCARCGLTKIQ